MTDAWGVDSSYLDGDDQEQVIGDETIDRLRALIGQPPDDLEDTAPIVTRPGAVNAVAGELALEDGGSLRIGGTVPLDAEAGRPEGDLPGRPAGSGLPALAGRAGPGACRVRDLVRAGRPARLDVAGVARRGAPSGRPRNRRVRG